MTKKNPKEELEIEKAIGFLVDCIRESGKNPKPVILHSIRVGMRLFEMGENKEVIMAGFLHDLLEDSDCTKDEIEKQFGKKVTNYVSLLTNGPSIENLEQLEKFNREVALIRLVDAKDNLFYLPLVKDPKKYQEFLLKHKFLSNFFKTHFSGLDIYKEYERKLREFSSG